MLLQVSFVGLSLGLCRLSTAWGIFGERHGCLLLFRETGDGSSSTVVSHHLAEIWHSKMLAIEP